MVSWKRQSEISQKLVCLEEAGIARHVFIHDLLGLFVLASEDQAPHPLQILTSLGIRVVVRSTRPERILIQLESFPAAPSENDCPQAAIADRQSFDPPVGFFRIPQSKISVGQIQCCRFLSLGFQLTGLHAGETKRQ